MTSFPRAGLPVAISAFDLHGARDLLVHGCEDCACAVTGERVLRTPVAVRSGLQNDDTRWVAARNVVDESLGAERRLLFNPLGSGGVVVVNDPGHRVFESFKDGATLAGAQRSLPRTRGLLAFMRRLAELQMIYPDGQLQRPDFALGRVLTAWLHVTNGCNLRCPYCYVNKSNEPMDEGTGRAAVEAIMKSAVRHGFPVVKLKYAGGEASLNHRVMLRLHAYASALAAERGLSLQSVLLSNGVALGEGLIESLKTAGIKVMISLDGVGDLHDAQRPTIGGKPSFKLVERGINRLIARDHAPHLSITVTGRNSTGLADAVRFALERDLTFSVNLFRDNDCAATFSDLRYEEQTMIDSLHAAFSVIEEQLPPWSVLGSVLDRGQLLEQRQRSCGVGQDYLVIDQRGGVAKCHMEIEKTLGDVFRDDPLELIRQDTTTALNLSVEEKEGCRDCTWKYWCTGGCTVATFRATGRYDIKSPNCNIYRAIYPRALRLEGLRLVKYASSNTSCT